MGRCKHANVASVENDTQQCSLLMLHSERGGWFSMSEAVEKLRPPSEVLEDMPYQAVPPMADEKYQRLAADIKERGVIQPIVTDEEGTILDGHHRAAIAEQLDLDESRKPTYVTLGDLDDDREKLARAIKTNLLGRDTGNGVKSEAVTQYIETTWPTDDETDALVRPETNAEVAEKLGVSTGLVSGVVKKFNGELIDHDRLKAREYYRDNPDTSYREVARQVETGKTTVTEWLKEDFDEGDDEDEDDDQTAWTLFSKDKDEHEKSQDLAQQADEDDSAKEQTERVAQNKTSVSTAHKNTEKEQAKEETERQRSEPDEVPARIIEADAIEFINTFDDGEIDLLLTDPPYSSDIDDIHEFASSWVPAALEKVASDGHAYICIGEYPDEIAAYYNIIADFEQFDEVQLLAWTYRNTIGKMPNRRYGRGWQAVLYLCGEDADDLDVPETKEQFSSMDITAPDGRHGTKHHKWQKPDELFERFIRHSTSEGDLVVDPFAGSGTTLLEAAKLGRENRGCDADPEAIQAALTRGCTSDA